MSRKRFIKLIMANQICRRAATNLANISLKTYGSYANAYPHVSGFGLFGIIESMTITRGVV